MRSVHSRVRLMAYISLFSALLVLCSWISLPASPPVTLQTFAVFTAALCLGRRSVAVILVYLMMGAVGVPVFAGFSGGIGHLAGITGGYVLGFLPAAAIAGSVSDRKSDAVRAAGCFAGLAVCYAAGSAWFVLHGSRGAAGWGAAFVSCVVPYILPDAGKILLALAVSRILCRHIRLGK